MDYDIEKKYTAEYLRELSPEALLALAGKARQAFLDLRTQNSPHGRVKYVARPHLTKKVRRDIARMETIINQPIQVGSP